MDIITFVILAVLLLICFIYFIKSRIIRGLSFLLKLAFPFLVIVALSALFVPSIYTQVADFSVKQSQVYVSIQNLDKTISPLFNLGGSIFDGIFGGNSQTEDKKVVEDTILPGVVDLIGELFRLVALIVSIAGLIGLTYFSYSFENVFEVSELKAENKTLKDSYFAMDKRIKQLEAMLVSPGKTKS